MGIPRKSRFTERISKMRGLMPIEKDLLRRIGELSDGAINNRAPTNPGVLGRRILIRSPILPPPTGLTVKVGPKSAKIEWHPVDSPVLQMYEAEVKNKDTNLTDVKFCFTNRIYIGGTGRFRVKIRSVSRQGYASPYSSTVLDFTLLDDVMFLEGTGVGPTQKSNLVIEDIATPAHYKVFAWGSINLGNFTDAFQTSVPVMDLRINGWYPLWSRIIGFRETALFSNLDDAGIIGEDRTPTGGTRSGMLMTPLSWMFKPFYVEALPGIAGTVPKFYMAITNSQDDTGETNLSLLSIPAALTTVREEAFISGNSIDLGTTSGLNVNSGPGGSAPNRGIDLGTGSSFTIGTWIKIPTSNIYAGIPVNQSGTWNFSFLMSGLGYYGIISDPTGGPKVLGEATRGSFLISLNTLGGGFTYGEGVYPTWIPAYGRCIQNLEISMVGGSISPSGFGKPDSARKLFSCAFKDGWLQDRQPNEVEDDLYVKASGKWIFIVATYDSDLEDQPQWTWFSTTPLAQGLVNKCSGFWNGQRLTPRQMGPSASVPAAAKGKYLGYLDGNVVPSGYGTGFTSDNMIVDSLATTISAATGYVTDYSDGLGHSVIKNMRMYWTAMWDGVLSDAAILHLSQTPGQDLRTSSGDYTEGASLAHWWVFGQNPSPIDKGDICTDLGGGYPISLTENSSKTLAQLTLSLKDDRPTDPAGTSAGAGSDSTPF